MDATRVYPNWPPVVATTGLAGALAAPDPDVVPLNPELVNDARRRFTGSAVDALGVLQLHVRNHDGHAYLRAHKRMKMAPGAAFDRPIWLHSSTEALYFRKHYRQHVPNDVLQEHIEEDFRPDKAPAFIPKWQGNALAGAATASGDHIVFFPTGPVLQQACALVQPADSRSGSGAGADAQNFTTKRVETGTTIRQFAVLGRPATTLAPPLNEPLFVAARGAAQCTVLQAPSHCTQTRDAPPSERHLLHTKLKLTFDEMLYHVAASPHVDAELAFVTGDGLLHTWIPESSVQTLAVEAAMASERLLRCEYASHPCVLWSANRFTVRSVDLRERAKALTQYDKVFDLASVGSPLAEIYDLKRRSSCPFQFIVGSGVSIEVIDCRMPSQSLLSWAQPVATDGAASAFGAIEEVDVAAHASESRGAIVSTSQHRKVATVYSFERCRKPPRGTALAIIPLRSSDDGADAHRAHTSQYVVSDAPLDLPLLDGGEWTTLLGVCALPLASKRTRGARVYQMNDLGDLFSQTISARGRGRPYDAAVQPDLPLGVTSLAPPAASSPKRKRLPLPVDALLPEHDSASITPFVPLALKLLRRKYPRLPRARERRPDEPEPTIDAEHLVTTLQGVCCPSATVFRLHRFVNDDLAFPITARDLTLFLRSRGEFHVRSVYHAHREPVAHVLPPSRAVEHAVHERSDDPRLDVCTCCPRTAEAPCDSFACIVPHALVVSPADGQLRLDELCARGRARPSRPSELFDVIAEAREAYGVDGV